MSSPSAPKLQNRRGALEALLERHDEESLKTREGQLHAANTIVTLYSQRYLRETPETLVRRLLTFHFEKGLLFYNFYVPQTASIFCHAAREDINGENTLTQLLDQLLLQPLELRMDRTTHSLFPTKSFHLSSQSSSPPPPRAPSDHPIRKRRRISGDTNHEGTSKHVSPYAVLAIPHQVLSVHELLTLSALAAVETDRINETLLELFHSPQKHPSSTTNPNPLYCQRLLLVHHLFLYWHTLMARTNPDHVLRKLRRAWCNAILRVSPLLSPQAVSEQQWLPSVPGLQGLIDIFTSHHVNDALSAHTRLLSRLRDVIHPLHHAITVEEHAPKNKECSICAQLMAVHLQGKTTSTDSLSMATNGLPPSILPSLTHYF